ncbi:MAG: hypothetical protein COZ06_00785 [Armatimonadetes bacterium CG_4_10_14_3_um_filter_66_18]|nr:MAG: hypothetical protein COZ06_00785 [Armatimonadetes bacterium CG_4_10_14_3_um_filter_66_18]
MPSIMVRSGDPAGKEFFATAYQTTLASWSSAAFSRRCAAAKLAVFSFSTAVFTRVSASAIFAAKAARVRAGIGSHVSGVGTWLQAALTATARERMSSGALADAGVDSN